MPERNAGKPGRHPALGFWLNPGACVQPGRSSGWRPRLLLAMLVTAVVPPVAGTTHPQSAPPAPLLPDRQGGETDGRLDEGTPPVLRARQPLEPMLLTQFEEGRRSVDLDGTRTFSLRVADARPIKEVLLLLVRDSPFSVVSDPDVAGTFTGELKDVTLRQALDLIVRPLGLDYAVQNTFIRVSPRRVQTRIFDINYLMRRRSGRRAQMRVDRQVQIRARVFEIDLDEAHPAGIDWREAIRAMNDPDAQPELASADGSVIVLGVKLSDYGALATALAFQGGVKVLASPQVMAMNNEPTIMRVGTQDIFFVATSQIDPVSGRVVQTTMAPQSVTSGLVLTITPQIAADGIIQIRITPSLTERTGETKSRLGDTVPILSVREADTLVRVRDGETVVIAGLLQDRETSAVSEGFAALFKREEKRTARTELVILITPSTAPPGTLAARH
ncbi:MAG: hypothetical protein LC804_28305 [Acidobacteria bacterium]|nr:hypothetical protein [Acidobacteriota bacterium]